MDIFEKITRFVQKAESIVAANLTHESTAKTHHGAHRVHRACKVYEYGHQAHVRKIFTATFSTKDKIIFSLYDLRGLCGEKIAFLQGSQLIQKFRLRRQDVA
jgi:ABC-type nickel/cobalt efflux system permease component RcnA